MLFPEPLAIRNEGVLELPTTMLIGAVDWPWTTLTVPPDRFVVNEKLMVVAVTCKLTVVEPVVEPDPVTVTCVVLGDMLPGV